MIEKYLSETYTIIISETDPRYGTFKPICHYEVSRGIPVPRIGESVEYYDEEYKILANVSSKPRYSYVSGKLSIYISVVVESKYPMLKNHK